MYKFSFLLLAVVFFAGCGGGSGGSIASQPVAAPGLSLTASPARVSAGGVATLRWQASNATSCTASGDWSGVRLVTGTLQVGPLQRTSTFRLTCSGEGGQVQRSVSVEVAAPAVFLDAAPNPVDPGGTTRLAWSASNASACQAFGAWSGSRPVSGQETTGPLETASLFGLSCTAGDQTATAEVLVEVGETETSLVLTANPPAIGAGETTRLSWASSGVSSCEASGGWAGSRPPSGSEETAPLSESTTFTLSCQGSEGPISESVTVALNSVSGDILLPAFARTDSDVNDPNADYRDNGSLDRAQPLPNPVVVGGYVNHPFRGPAGRSFAAGDFNDVYVVDLVEGQLIELQVPSADPALPDSLRTDIDLGLYDADGVLVDESVGLGKVEQLTAPASGPYFVRVRLYAGAGLYRLTVGQSGLAAAAGGLRLSDEFVPGEVVVLDSGDTGSVDAGAPELVSRHGLGMKAGGRGRPMLMDLPDAARTTGLAKPAGPGEAELGFSVPPGLAGKRRTLLEVKRLSAQADLPPVSLNRILRNFAAPADPLYATQRWHYELIRLPAARDILTGSPEVTVAVVDSGVVPHPDLDGNLVPGFDFVSSPLNEDGDGIDPDPDDPGCGIGGGSIFHGTHVSGTVSAVTDNALGGAGVAGNVSVMPVRVLDGCQGAGTFYDVIQGIRFAAGLPNDAGRVPERTADIINLSLGGAGACDPGLQSVFDSVRARGVTVVAAAGNEATSRTTVPAACPGVISVSAVGPTRERAYYSNFGADWVDIAAPGGDLRADINGDGVPDGVLSTDGLGGGGSRSPAYSVRQGTSMAAPHVAGVFALMKSASPGLTPAEIDSLLRQGLLTTDIGPPGPDALGTGLVDALRAVQAAGRDVSQLPPVLSVTPASLNFGNVASRAELLAVNGGAGELEITGVTSSAPWLAATALDVDDNGLGRYEIRVSREALEPGVYSGSLGLSSSAGQVQVNVLMQVTAVAGQPNAGFQYVLLVDPDSLATEERIVVDARGERVAYRFASLDSGTYFVVGGTDMDNDGFICDDGEACGAYPVDNEPLEVTVEGPVSGLDFTSTFRTSLDPAAATDSRAPALEGFSRTDASSR